MSLWLPIAAVVLVVAVVVAAVGFIVWDALYGAPEQDATPAPKVKDPHGVLRQDGVELKEFRGPEA